MTKEEITKGREALQPLAKVLCCTVGAHYAGVTVDYFTKRYQTPDKPVGEFWLMLATIVHDQLFPIDDKFKG